MVVSSGSEIAIHSNCIACNEIDSQTTANRLPSCWLLLYAWIQQSLPGSCYTVDYLCNYLEKRIEKMNGHVSLYKRVIVLFAQLSIMMVFV